MTALLKDRLPIFRFSKAESWFPIGVEESLKIFGYEWDGSTFVHNVAHSRMTRLNFPGDMEPLELPPVVYHRVITGGGLEWHQYWLWYLYNPWGIGGVGKHEGDWEFVQVGYAPCDNENIEPVLLTYSQHHNGGIREWWAAEQFQNRPVVYVALGSHANYFATGRQGGGIDLCDGGGMDLTDYELREFGGWADWPGRWGNSMGEGKSPESPGQQTIRWKCPHLYHSNSSRA